MIYKTISMDPPWPEYGGGRCKRGADRHYPLIKTKQDILATILHAEAPYPGEPIFTPDTHGCLLWCWATRNYLPWAFWLIEALGFRYITDIVWVKGDAAVYTDTRPAGPDVLFRLEHAGLGQWTRSLHEHLLLARMGKVKVPVSQLRPPSVVVAPRGAHSEKPGVFYEIIERLSQPPRLEMFARARRDGWDAWGDGLSAGAHLP